MPPVAYFCQKAYELNKRKIINDPVYGFISIPSETVYDLIEHPWFQRLRRIKQMGLADYVYPGALHNRFHHALGAMHLMGQAIYTLRSKGHLIWETESEAAQIAILLHDIGHGPFSHVLEPVLLSGVHHESMSLMLMKELNRQFDGKLEMAIQMFEGTYPRKFFHQLISSQLDMDRMDYLNRDCFYSGVAEGTIGAERLIKMLDIHDNEIVVEQKGLLSIENFLNARRLMYWQVYLHKTSICAEAMLSQIFVRARDLSNAGDSLFGTPRFIQFLTSRYVLEDFRQNPELLNDFTRLDDYDVWASIKAWADHSDPILAKLCRMLLNRQLFKIRFVEPHELGGLREEIRLDMVKSGLTPDQYTYFSTSGQTTNTAYLIEKEEIKTLLKSGEVIKISELSDMPSIRAMSKIVHKYYICWAKDVSLHL